MRSPRPLLPRPFVEGPSALLVVVGAAILSHVTALAAGFIWLDHAHIEGGLGVAPLGQVASLFRRGFAGTGFYRPLMSVSLSLDAALGGGAWLFHATTLAWHAGAAVMVVLTGQALTLPRPAALLAGLLFAVHPATSLVADAIAFRSEAMMVVMLLALILFHIRGRPVLAAGALLAGALTKETALVLGPAFVLTLELVGRLAPDGSAPGFSATPDGNAKGKGNDNGNARARGKVLGAEAAALIVALGLRSAFAPPWRAALPSFSFSEAIGTRLAVLTRALFLFWAPVDLSACDDFPVTSALGLRALVGGGVGLGLALALALALLARHRRGGRLAAVLLLGLSVLPALQIIPVSRWWSPHYCYLAFAIACWFVAEALLRFRHWGAVAGVAIAAACAGLSLAEGRRYHDDDVFWAAELTAHPACREAQFYAGESARERSDWEVAAAHYLSALTPTAGVLSYVDTPAALQNLGVTRLNQRRFDEAEAAFGRARGLAGDDQVRRELTHNMAAAALGAGHAEVAVRLLEPEVSRPDAFPQSLVLQARALHGLGRDAEAASVAGRLHLPSRANTTH